MKKIIKLFILGLSFIPFSVGTIDISFTTRIEHKKMLNANDNKFILFQKSFMNSMILTHYNNTCMMGE